MGEDITITMSKQDKKNVVENYWKLKKIITFAVDADQNDPRARLIKQSMTIEELENISNVIKACEDIGVQYLERELN